MRVSSNMRIMGLRLRFSLDYHKKGLSHYS